MKFLKKRHSVWMLLALMCVLTGCGGDREEVTAPTAYRVVWKIEIRYRNGDQAVRRSCEDPEQMQMIMNYLRWIKPYGTPEEDPMTQQGEEIDVQLQYSDGTAKTYHQRCGCYFREGEAPWRNIDPEQARELNRIMEILDRAEHPSDPDTTPPLLRPKLKCTKKEAVLLS